MRSNDTLARLPHKKMMPVGKIRSQQASPRGPWAISRENVHNAPQVERRRGPRALQILPAVGEDVQDPRGGGRTSSQACSRCCSSRGGDSEPACRLNRCYQISARDLQFLALRSSACRWELATTLTDDVCAVSAFFTHDAGLHCALPSIATLSAASRVLRRVILSEMKAVRRFFSIHKTVCSSASRRALLFCAPQS